MSFDILQSTVDKFLRYYESRETRPVFESVEEMLQWAGLYNLTTSNLGLELAAAGLSPLLVQELVTVRAFDHSSRVLRRCNFLLLMV